MSQYEPNVIPALLRQLREELNRVTGVVQLLAPLVNEHGEERHADYLAILNQGVYRTLRAVRNLEFVGTDHSPDELRPVVLDLAGLCRDTWRFCADLLDEQMDIDFTYESNTPSALVLGDTELLHRLLLNLISNAAQAAGKGGRLSLRVTADRERVRFTLWNSGGDRLPGGGAGDPDSLLPREQGLGLGLDIARTIASLHGGALVFERQASKGVSATYSMPTAEHSRFTLRENTGRADFFGGFDPTLVELSPLLGSDLFAPCYWEL